MESQRHRKVTTRTNRRRWPSGMRMKLVINPEALADRMDRKDFSNRRLAKYAECSPGTIDNLLSGRTKAVNKGRTAELICEALDVQMDVYFVPEISSGAIETDKRTKSDGRRRTGKLRVA